MKKEKILILFDVASPTTLEQDFSEELKTEDWETEKSVIKALKNLGHSYELLGLHNEATLVTQKIKQFKPDIIFNLAESFNNQSELDRDVASFLKLTGIPFTGCDPTGLTLCKDKGISKKILSFHKIRVPKFVILPKNKAIKRPVRLPFPIFIKPLSNEASYGISQASFVENDTQFKERVKFIHDTMHSDAIAEEYIEGKEIYVSILGNTRLEVFPIREMTFHQVPDDEPKFATFKAKWDKAYRKKWGIQNRFLKGISEETEKKIKRISKKIYKLLSIRGYARLDMRLTPSNEVVFIEANPNPILSEWEDFAESAKKSGLSYPQIIQKIINLSKQEEQE